MKKFIEGFKEFHHELNESRYEDQYFSNELGDSQFCDGLAYEGTIDCMERYMISDFLEYIGYSLLKWQCKRFGHKWQYECYVSGDTAHEIMYCTRCMLETEHTYY